MKQKENFYSIKPDISEPANEVVRKVARALIALRSYELALQKTETIDGDGKNANFTLFERIGRGGIPITQRQLAVSQLMLELGKDANDAVAEFQNGDWRDILDTEEIIHAVTRISHAHVSSPPDSIDDKHGWKALMEWDMFELDIAKIKEMKRKKYWDLLKIKMGENCKRLKESFDAIFSNVLRHGTSGEARNGLSLVQLAQTTREGGVQPITLHPLLYWAFYIRKDGQEVDAELHRNMLQWIVFSNGVVSTPAHKKLNQLAFHQIASTKKLDFLAIKEKVFSSNFDDKERGEIGFAWNSPVLDIDNNIVEKEIMPKDIPSPRIIVERTIRRLVLRNSADRSGVNDFILMWNQREMLDEIYGNTDPKHIHALYGKGRPVDADHIVARNLFMAINVDKDDIKAAVTIFLSEEYKKNVKVGLNENTFRLHLTNLNGNFRFWPKHLNRADQDRKVNDKFPKDEILKLLEKHPMREYFEKHNDDIGWTWSAILHKSDWGNLPPENNVWTESSITRFITAVMKREYDLYASAYNFLMPDKSKSLTPLNDLNEIIMDKDDSESH